MALHIKQLKQNRMFQEVVEQLEEAILGGDLRPGDKLPPEMKLKEMFQTSRGTIREAIRVLEEKGLVEIRQGLGGGTVVKAMDHGKVAENLVLFLRSNHVSFDVVAEFRESVEGQVSAMAADKAGPDDLARLQGILEQAAEVLAHDPHDWEGHYQADEELHVAIAQIAGNPIFLAVLSSVHFNILDSNDRFAPKSPDSLRGNLEDLAGIVDAIQKGDRDQADLAARQHVRRFNELMKEQEKTLAQQGGRNA